MAHRDFSEKLWQHIEDALAEELKLHSRPVAAFDADGTLWATDLGESFFQYQIRKNLLPDVFARYPDPWRHYRDWKESGDPRPAYLWLAQINAGRPLSEVRSWAAEHVRVQTPMAIFPAQQQLIQHLISRNVQVFVVTASVAWAVEPGALLFGVPHEQVLGVRTLTDQGVVTDKPDGEITYREGKIKSLLTATKGQKPFLACGNTLGDWHLLEGAKLRLAVTSTQPTDELFKAEQGLQQKIRNEKSQDSTWLTHSF